MTLLAEAEALEAAEAGKQKTDTFKVTHYHQLAKCLVGIEKLVLAVFHAEIFSS